MKYLGYNIYYSPGFRYARDESGKVYEAGYSCEVYNVSDDEMSNLLDSFFLSNIDEKEVQAEIRKYINTHHYRLKSERNAILYERSNSLIGRFIRDLCENLGDCEAYKHLKQHIGMKDEEILCAGFSSLAKYFNQEAYAQTIAEYMINVGTENTISGNWHFEFEEINDRFGINLYENNDIKNAIEEHLWNADEIVSDVICDSDFDLMFYLHYCPNAEDNDETDFYNDQSM